MNPNGFPFEFPRSDAVVAAVPERVSFRSECLSETLGQELAVDLGPAHSQVMTQQVSRSRKGFGIRPAGLMLSHIVTQDRLTQPTRTAVDEHNQLLLAQAKLLELASVEDILDNLEFGEVIAAPKSSESFIEVGGLEFFFGENLADFVGPDVLEVEGDLSPAVELHVPPDQVGLEQRHTAADIPTDEVRIDQAFGYERRTDRAAFAGVQIRETDSQAHTFQLGSCIQLAESLAFNPALGRSEQARNTKTSKCWPFAASRPGSSDSRNSRRRRSRCAPFADGCKHPGTSSTGLSSTSLPRKTTMCT